MWHTPLTDSKNISLPSRNHRAPSLGTRGSQTSFSVQNFILRPCTCRARHFAVGWITREKHAAHPNEGRNLSAHRPLTCTDTGNHQEEANNLDTLRMKQRNKTLTARDCHVKTVGRFFSLKYCMFHRECVFHWKTTITDPCTQEFFFFCRATTGRDPCILEILIFSRGCRFFSRGCRFVRGAVQIFPRAVEMFLGSVHTTAMDSLFKDLETFTECSCACIFQGPQPFQYL